MIYELQCVEIICLGWNVVIVFSQKICPTHESCRKSMPQLWFEDFDFKSPKSLKIVFCEKLRVFWWTENKISERDIAYRFFKSQRQKFFSKIHICFPLLCVLPLPLKCLLMFRVVYWYIRIFCLNRYLLKYCNILRTSNHQWAFWAIWRCNF